MATNWSQENWNRSAQVEREAEGLRRGHRKSLARLPAPQIDHPLTNRVETESLPPAGSTQWRNGFIGWNMLLAALAGVAIFFFLNVVSFGVLGHALTAAGIVAAVGLGHYLFWGRMFAREVPRERQPTQNQVRRLETTETVPPGEFVLRLDNRERMELLQLLEHSLARAIRGREERGDSTAIRQELQDKIRMFGA